MGSNLEEIRPGDAAQTDIESAIEFLPRPRQWGSHASAAGATGAGQHRLKWRHFSPALTLIFFIYDLALLWHAQVGHRLAPKSALDRLWYPQKDSVSFEDILRTLRHVTWQERVFSDPALDGHTRKLLQPFVEWAKTLT